MASKIDLMVWADGTANTECYYSDRMKCWVFVDHLNDSVERSAVWVEVTASVDPDDSGLNSCCIACDLEGEGLWVLPYDRLEDYEPDAGMDVVRAGTADGEVIDAAEFERRAAVRRIRVQLQGEGGAGPVGHVEVPRDATREQASEAARKWAAGQTGHPAWDVVTVFDPAIGRAFEVELTEAAEAAEAE